MNQSTPSAWFIVLEILKIAIPAAGILVTAVVAVAGILVTATLAVSGWFASYVFMTRAQARNLQNQLANDARLEMTTPLRAYADWLYRVNGAVLRLKQFTMSEPWDKACSDITTLFVADRVGGHDWLTSLEDYEILFPETRDCRIALMERDIEIGTLLFDFSLKLTGISLERPEKQAPVRIRVAEAFAGESIEMILDQAALIDDLRIHLQNKCLHQITGSKVPERRPGQPGRPVLRADMIGILRIVPYQET